MATRRRKRHEQLELSKLDRRRDKNGQYRGGRRVGAGCKPKGERAGVPHKRRPYPNAEHPLHIVLRVAIDVARLRNGKGWRAVRRALTVTQQRRVPFRIVHFSLQRNHIHMVCEADSKEALTKGMQSFTTSVARQINRELGRSGEVFPDRYYADPITSLRKMRHTLSYVLNNWRKHQVDRDTAGLFGGRIDPYSSGVWFMYWKERTLDYPVVPSGYDPPDVSNARSWLLTEGCRRFSPISVHETPGPRP
jgi:REP element-mobilizing transposase RayT